MRFLIKTISGRQGYKSFKNLNEYVDFMTNKGHLIQDLKEADLPYTDKPVKLPKVSKSNGWSEVSDFGGVGEEPEKGESLIASTSKSVMKDEASFEMSKSSGKADKPEMGLGAEKGDVDMSDFKSFEYEEPKLKSSETKSEKPSSEEPKKESSEKKEETKEEKSSTEKNTEEKSSDKKDSEKKDIKESVEDSEKKYRITDNSNGQIREFNSLEELNEFLRNDQGLLGDDEFLSSIEDFENWERKNNGGVELHIEEITKHDKEIEECLKAAGVHLDEGIKDYLPRAGFIRDNDEDKNSSKMGIWGGQGTDEQLRKAKIIAKVKFANGDRFGRVTKADLDNFDEYKRQYDEIYGMDESLNEGWKDKFKKGAATLGVAASLAGNAMAHDPMYDGARNPNTEDVEIAYSQNDYEKPQIKKITKDGLIIDQFGNEWTKEDFEKELAGGNPFYDGARNPNTEEFDESDDGFDDEIAECLKSAGC